MLRWASLRRMYPSVSDPLPLGQVPILCGIMINDHVSIHDGIMTIFTCMMLSSPSLRDGIMINNHIYSHGGMYNVFLIVFRQ